MGISQFPPVGGGAAESNDFILNKNNSINDTFILPRAYPAGGYALRTGTPDSSFDVYLINAAGSSVGYSNGSAIVASEAFDTVVFFGIGTAETCQFSYSGSSTNATSRGEEPGASPYLTSISPFDLQNINDTATVIGGNFSTAVQITFESGTAVLAAKNIVRTNSTALVVTRPDNLINDLSPYSLRAINPGVTPPTGTNVNLLVGTVTAGADPTFITPNLITGARAGIAFSTSILVSDSDGTVVNWAITAGTLPPGLSLATATGAISGTPTTNGDYFFTVRITDDGQNTNSREFNLPVGFQITATNSTVVGGTSYAWFTASGTAIFKNPNNTALPYVVIAGGGASGHGLSREGGGGGAGGLLFGTATITASATAAITVGAGGAAASGLSIGGNGGNSLIATIATATGGGAGGYAWQSIDAAPGAAGGSGGGAPSAFSGRGTGIAGQGNDGGGGVGSVGGGGGAGSVGSAGGNGGAGRDFGAWASAINIIYNAGFFAGGGAGGAAGTGGVGGGGNAPFTNGSVNSGGGGASGSNRDTGTNGGSGLVIMRWT